LKSSYKHLANLTKSRGRTLKHKFESPKKPLKGSAGAKIAALKLTKSIFALISSVYKIYQTKLEP
jgi:hypothetical protein